MECWSAHREFFGMWSLFSLLSPHLDFRPGTPSGSCGELGQLNFIHLVVSPFSFCLSSPSFPLLSSSFPLLSPSFPLLSPSFPLLSPSPLSLTPSPSPPPLSPSHLSMMTWLQYVTPVALQVQYNMLHQWHYRYNTCSSDNNFYVRMPSQLIIV